MRYRLTAFFLTLLMCLSLSAAFLAEPFGGLYVASYIEGVTESEEQELSDYAKGVSEKHGIEISAVLYNSVDDSDLTEFADFYYNEHDFSDDGIMLFVECETDNYVVLRRGRGQTVLNDSEITQATDSYDSDNAYYGGVAAFIKTLDTLLSSKDTSANQAQIPAERQGERLVDREDLITATDESQLLAKLNEISERQECDIVIVTVGSLDGKTAMAYADDYFDYNGYGYGNRDDGILLLLSMQERDWWVSTYGYGITAITDAGLHYIMDNVVSYLSNGEYYKGFDVFADYCDSFLTQAKTGEPYDNGNLPREPLSLIWIPISLIAGAIVSIIALSGDKAALKSVRSQPRADSYVKKDSMNLRTSRDTFLFRNVSKTRRQTESSSGGGSSTHTSSSGRTHGGGGGKF